MRSYRKQISSIGILLFFVPGSSFSERGKEVLEMPLWTRVRSGDSVGGILNRLGICPLWSESSGSVGLTIQLNSQAFTKENGHLKVGSILILPRNILPESTDYRISGREVLVDEGAVGKCTEAYRAHHAPKSVYDKILPSDEGASPATVVLPTDKLSEPIRELASQEHMPVSRFGVGIGLEYFSIAMLDRETGGGAKLLSQASPKGSFFWKLAWSEEIESRLHYSVVKEKFVPVTSGAGRFEPDPSLRSEFGMGIVRQLSPRVRLGASLGGVGRSFVRYGDDVEIKTDHIQMLTFKLLQQYHIIRVKSAVAGIDITTTFLKGSQVVDAKAKDGWGLEGSLFFLHALDHANMELSGELTYGFSQQNTTRMNLKEKHLGMLFGVARRFE